MGTEIFLELTYVNQPVQNKDNMFIYSTLNWNGTNQKLTAFAIGQNFQAPNNVVKNLVINFSFAPARPLPSSSDLNVK